MDGFDQPLSPTPSLKIPKTVRMVIMGAVVLLMAVIGIILFVRGRSQTPDQLVQTIQATKTTCADAANPAACESQALGSLAETTGRVELCEALEGNAYDQCVWGAAREQGHPEWCASLEQKEDVSSCTDGTYLVLAQKKNDSRLCEKIVNEERKKACVNLVLGPVTGANCLSRGFATEVCVQYAVLDAAVAAHDSEKCRTITDELVQGECLELVGSASESLVVDTDGDGLSDADEAQYKTDPNKEDTDGDGFSDGDEVKNGYNPLGSGRL